MPGSARVLFPATLTLLCCGLPGAQALAEEPRPVLVQELRNVRASGKVMTALWTVRTNTYTLQLVLPTPAGATTAARIAAASCTSAKVQVWLLRSDGSQTHPAGHYGPQSGRPVCGMRTTAYEYSYSFSLEEGQQAIAAVVQINGEFFLDPLQPLGTPLP